MAALGVEIEAGRRGNARFGQHAAAEFTAVIGQPRDVHVDVEGPIRRREPIETGARQLLEQERAVLGIATDVGFELVPALERR